jgi:hypothetical protein
MEKHAVSIFRAEVTMLELRLCRVAGGGSPKEGANQDGMQ